MSDIMEGGTYIGDEALAAGLVDKIMSFDEALAYAMGLAKKKLDEENNLSDYTGYSNSFNGSNQGQGGAEMAKKFSKAALAALANAKNVEAKLPEVPEEVVEEQKPDASAEVPEVPEEVVEEQKPDVASEELAALTEKLVASDEALASVKAELEESKSSLAALTVAHAEAVAPLTEVIVGQINGMRIALSLSTVEMSDWSAGAVLTEYNSVMKTFEKSLPVGGVVPDEKADNKEAITRSDVSAIKNLSLY